MFLQSALAWSIFIASAAAAAEKCRVKGLTTSQKQAFGVANLKTWVCKKFDNNYKVGPQKTPIWVTSK
jgi:hypothetical protein